MAAIYIPNNLDEFVDFQAIIDGKLLAKVSGQLIGLDTTDGISTPPTTSIGNVVVWGDNNGVQLSDLGISITSLATDADLEDHINDINNPHQVTYIQTGSDASGSASAAQSYAIQRNNHTGTQTLSTISDAGTICSQNSSGVNITGGTISGTNILGYSLVTHNHDLEYDSLGSAASVQSNLDTHEGLVNNPHSVTALQVGAVEGPASGIDNNIVLFDGVTGKIIQDAGFNISDLLYRINHSGTQSISTLSDLGTNINTILGSNLTGNSKYLGTDSGGNPGVFNLPTAGTGDVVGPESAIDNGIVIFDGTTGKLVQDSTLTTNDILFRTNHSGTQTLSTISDAGTIASQDSNNVNIDGGNIDGTIIGQHTQTSGFFTNLSASGVLFGIASDNHNHDADYDALGSAASVQANLDTHEGLTNNPHSVTASQVGAVEGPASAVDSRIAAFDGTTGDLLKDGGLTIADVLNRDNHTSTQSLSTLNDLGSGVGTQLGLTIAGSGGSVGAYRLVSTQHSLTGGGDLHFDRTISLVNDSASPGNSKYYGTDGVGTRGFFDIPTGDVVGPGSALDNNLVTFDGSTGKLIQDSTYKIADLLYRANHSGTQTLSTISDAGTIASQSSSSVDIDGGSIDGTIIGANSATAATFTTVNGKVPDRGNVITASGTELTLDESNAGSNTIVRLTNAGSVTVTIDNTLTYTSGASYIWHLRQAGAGVGTVGGSGVTVNGNTNTAGQHTSMYIWQVAEDIFDLEGGSA